MKHNGTIEILVALVFGMFCGLGIGHVLGRNAVLKDALTNGAAVQVTNVLNEVTYQWKTK